MFKRYPYKGWLFLSLLLWGLAVARYYQKTLAITPKNMATAVEKDLQQKESTFETVLNDQELISRVFNDQLTSGDIEYLSSLSFGVYAYIDDTIIFWNSNKVLAECAGTTPADTTMLFQNERGKFIKECITYDSTNVKHKLVVLYPIVTLYPFDNNYLQSSFEAANYIPVNTSVLTRKSDNSFPVASKKGITVFYLSFDEKSMPQWSPDVLMQIVLAIALLSSLLWLQLITINITRKKSVWHGLAIILSLMACFWAVTYYSILPFNLESLTLFKPQLYATSGLLPSLGHLLINAMMFLWLSTFILKNVPYERIRIYKLNTSVKFLLAVVFTVALIVYSFAFVNIISTLVTDSSISFDVSHFYTISSYTIIGLFTVGIITATSFTVVYLITYQLKVLVGKWVKYLMLAIVGVTMILLSETATSMNVSLILLFCLVVFVMLLDLKKLSTNSDLFSPQMIFWSALITAFAAAVLQYFNFHKEQDARIRFAQQVLRQRDNITEYTFRTTAINIAQDPVLKSFLRYANRSKRRAVNERFDALYLGGHLNKYKSKLLIFDERGRSLYNYDTLSYNTLVNYTKQSRHIRGTDLYYHEDAQDGHYYLAQIPVFADAAEKNKLGYVFIDMAVKEATGQSVYPELLQPGFVSGNRNAEGYSYGVYVNNKLLTQTSDYNFPVYLTDTIQGEHQFEEYTNSSELQYKTGDGKTVFVIRYHRLWLESITLFSYLFGIQMIISLLTALYRVYLTYLGRQSKSEKLINFTLRRRIHISFLGVVFVSFIIIGVITILFFTLQYKQNSRRKQQLVMQLVERATLQYLNEEKATENPDNYNKVVNTQSFKYFVTGLANAQKIDLNVYHASGVLGETSQEEIYDKSLFARIIPPEAYHKLSNGQQFLIEEERIGLLSYVSCYKPIRNKEGITLGYINVPFFSSEKELNFQISGILVGLINLYAFVFLISGVLTVFITQWITRSFSIVIKSFSRFSLKKNEPVSWPYDDEIGLLVNEYNKMVKKAEENARMLAQSEREGAWREMAQQVAHEIKNPLTPMKLHIQYLQQAIDNGYDNVNELARKVTVSLIEQIENLSYIASEFSNFAKMPEARPETFDLNELLLKTVGLYKNQSAVTVDFQPYSIPLKVHTDKSQLLRVFNNLLENAVQAIPEDRAGEVHVTLGIEGDEALIAFKDNGKGIEGDAVAHIFQPYFTTKTSGTGLGLAMTKKIIEFWKGTIRFETTPGKGTTFYITVPLANGAEV